MTPIIKDIYKNRHIVHNIFKGYTYIGIRRLFVSMGVNQHDIVVCFNDSVGESEISGAYPRQDHDWIESTRILQNFYFHIKKRYGL